MFGRARRPSSRKSGTKRNSVGRNEWLEPRLMMTASTPVVEATPPTVSHAISVGGGSAVTGKTASLSALGSDAEGASHLIYDWAVTSAPSGGSATFSANASNAAQNTTLTFTKAGTYGVSVRIVDALGLSVTTSMTVTVTPTLTSIKVGPSGGALSSSASVAVSGASQSLVAEGFDQFGNALASQPAYRWSTSLPSGAAAPGLSTSGSTATFTFSKAGAYEVTVQSGSISASATLDVVAKPTYITISQSGASGQVTGTTAQFSVSQFEDQFHNVISDATHVSWSATSLPAGAATPTFAVSGANATVTFTAAGQYVLKATEADNSGNSLSESITVTVAQTPTGLKQSTAAVTVTGTSQKLPAPTVVDQFGNALANQPALSWSATSVPGGATAPSFSTSGGTTTATFAAAGAYTLTAKVSGASSLSYVVTATVVSTSTSIVVTPNAASVAEGATKQFSAQALDQFGKAMQSQPTFTWSDSGGSITSGGLFTAPNSAASITITAKTGSLSGAATIAVQGASINLQNAFLSQLVQSLDSDGSISRDDMIQILDAVAAKGAVTTSEFADLQTIVNDAAALDMPSYVQQLASDVIDGNTANATYQGQNLGNLAVGSSAAKLTDLVGKWFLGTDLPTLTDSSLVYKTVSGSLFPTTPSIANEFQGELGDCYFISSLGTIADQDPAAIEDMFINNGDGTYTVRFYGGNYGYSENSNGSYSDGFASGSGTPEYVTVNLQLPTTTSGILVYADYGAAYNNASNSLWIPLAEKAYAEWNQTGQEGRDGTNTYAGIEGGWMATVDAQVLGHNATDYFMGTATEQQLISALSSGQAVTIGTINDEYGLYGSHAYAVTAYNASTNTFTLYNPWGFDQPGQLTWSELNADCSGFVAVNASGATAISGARTEQGAIGYFASAEMSAATESADSQASAAAASALGSNPVDDGATSASASPFQANAFQSSNAASDPSRFAAAPANGAATTPSTTDAAFGDGWFNEAGFELGTTADRIASSPGSPGSFQSLANGSVGFGAGADQSTALADAFYSQLGAIVDRQSGFERQSIGEYVLSS